MSGRPLAQRRHAQRVDVEAIVEILSKAARVDFALEIAVGGRDDARRDRDGPVAADTHHLPVFEHAQQLGLRRQRQLSDLVEKQRSAAGVLECAAAQAIGAGKRAALVAEQLALDQLLGQRRAVHRDERRLRARPQPMQLARDQLLARAALTDDQDTARNRRDTRDAHRAARASGALSPMSDVSPSNRDCSDRSSLDQPPARHRVFDLLNHALDRLRLVDESVRAQPHGLNAAIVTAGAGVDDDGRVDAALLQTAQDLETIGPRHLEIEDHAIDRLARQNVERLRRHRRRPSCRISPTRFRS